MTTFNEVVEKLKTAELRFLDDEVMLEKNYMESTEYTNLYDEAVMEKQRHGTHSEEVIKSYAHNYAKNSLIYNALIEEVEKIEDYIKPLKQSIEKTGLKIAECKVMQGWSFPIKVTLEGGYAFFIKKDNFIKNNSKYLSYILGYKMLYGLGIGPKFDWKAEQNKNKDIIFITQDLAYSKNPDSEREFSETESIDIPENEDIKLGFFVSTLMMNDVHPIDYDNMDQLVWSRKNCGVVQKKDKASAGKIFDFEIVTNSKRPIFDIAENNKDKQIKEEYLLNSTKYNKNGDFVKKAERKKLTNENKASCIKILEVKFKETVREYATVNNLKDIDENALWENKNGTDTKDLNLKELVDYKNQVLQNFEKDLASCVRIKTQKVEAEKSNKDNNLLYRVADKTPNNASSARISNNASSEKASSDKNDSLVTSSEMQLILQGLFNIQISAARGKKLKAIMNGEKQTKDGKEIKDKLTDLFPESDIIATIQKRIGENNLELQHRLAKDIMKAIFQKEAPSK